MTHRQKRVLWAAVVFGALVAFALGCRFRLYRRVSFGVRAWLHAREWKERSLWLSDYRVELEAVPIEGIDRNLSGLTWNNDTRTLFAIKNNPTQIVELSTAGKLLRRIVLVGFDDTEAVEYIGGGDFVVADERSQRIALVSIDDATREIDVRGLPRLTLGMGPAGNSGLEGLAWDSANKKLYAAKERAPVHIYEVTGFPQDPNTTMDIEVTSDSTRDQRLFVADVSSLDFNNHYQHLLVLSHESRLLIEIDKKGYPISSLSLAGGSGLRRPVPQAEGMAMDEEDVLYLVSEPNLFYVFRKQE